MILTKKIRLKPTHEQELLFYRMAGAARWAYNLALSEDRRVYDNWVATGKPEDRVYFNESLIRKHIVQLKKMPEFSWLKEISSQTVAEAVREFDKVRKTFLKNREPGQHLSFKSKRKTRPSFYTPARTIRQVQNAIILEKIGSVKAKGTIPDGKLMDPRIFYDGKYWYLTVSHEVEERTEKLTNVTLGIDLGIKELAVCSDGKVYRNINKTATVKKIKKKLKREQRRFSRKLEANVQSRTANGRLIYHRPLDDCKNFFKNKRKLKLLYRRLTNIRQNHLHQVTAEIAKTKPSRVVLEDLNISSMMRNRHLSKAIAEQKWYEFRRLLEYKCKRIGIQVVLADKFFASSKTCSHCGHVKRDLKLSDRTYRCLECGLIIDRDLNAAINLSQYQC